MDDRDDSLAQLYRRSSREEPPAQVDLAVMELARRSVKRRAWSPFGSPWLAGGAVAAVALVGVVLVVFMQEQTSLTALPEATRSAAPVGLPDASLQREADDEAIRLPLPPARQRQDVDTAAARRPAVPQGESLRQEPAQHSDGQAPRSGAVAPEQAPEPGPPKPRFDFYQTLPEQQAVVPSRSAVPSVVPAPVRAPAPVAAPVARQPPKPEAVVPGPQPEAPVRPAGPDTAPAAGYYLQVGAFRAADSAERFKARLAGLGLPAGVEAIVLDNRETWHRVRVGPYRDPEAADAVRGRLKAQGIDSLLVRTGE